MGEIQRGYCGPMTGKFGPGVGSFTAGRNFIRTLPIKKKNRPSTEAQDQVKAIFKMAFDFLDPMQPFLKKTFRKDGLVNGFHQAMRQVITNAVSGTPPVINFSLVKISKGSLKEPEAPVATPAAGALTFTWTNNADESTGFAADKSVLVAYCESLKRWAFTLNGAMRSAGTGTLTLPAAFSGKVVQSWMAFIRADGKKVSDGFFTGAVTAL